MRRMFRAKSMKKSEFLGHSRKTQQRHIDLSGAYQTLSTLTDQDTGTGRIGHGNRVDGV